MRFSGRTKVLAWAVRPDEALLHLHETVWRTLRDAPGSAEGSGTVREPLGQALRLLLAADRRDRPLGLAP
ncbi:hypothetical protein ABZ669_37750, partial [Streptomyces hirsutus]